MRFLRQQMQQVCRTLHPCGNFLDIPTAHSLSATDWKSPPFSEFVD
jgi:hypothetical protein